MEFNSKDERIIFLLECLENLAGGHFSPWYGEDAMNMRDYAKDSLAYFRKKGVYREIRNTTRC